MSTDLDPLVSFRTSVQWMFRGPELHEHAPQWGAIDRYKTEFVAGEILQVPAGIAKAREAAGLGTIIHL